MSGMNGMMNGKPCWSPAARTRVFEFGSAVETDDERESILAQAAELVRAGIKAGLVERAEVPNAPKPEKQVAAWRFTSCEKCGIGFFRANIGTTKCAVCRLAPVVCFCGKTFQPTKHKEKSCSKQCSRARQIATFQTSHNANKKPQVLAECIICRQMKPRRQAGETFAKTCSKPCAALYRKQRATEHNKAKTEARKK